VINSPASGTGGRRRQRNGASLLEMILLIEASGGEIAAIAVIVDWSGELHELILARTGCRYRATALWSLNLPTYEPGPATCPGCAVGLPIEAPAERNAGLGWSG
jgi:orotate phosphoribosyltransferase